MLGQLPIINIDFDFNLVPTHQLYWEKMHHLLNIDSVKEKKQNLYLSFFLWLFFSSLETQGKHDILQHNKLHLRNILLFYSNIFSTVKSNFLCILTLSRGISIKPHRYLGHIHPNRETEVNRYCNLCFGFYLGGLYERAVENFLGYTGQKTHKLAEGRKVRRKNRSLKESLPFTLPAPKNLNYSYQTPVKCLLS